MNITSNAYYNLEEQNKKLREEVSTLRHQKEELLETNRDLAKENSRLLDILNFYRIRHD